VVLLSPSVAEAKQALDAALRCMFGVEAVHMSVLYFLAYSASAGGLERLISARPKFGGQEFKVKVRATCVMRM